MELKAIRESLGLSQAALAEKLGVNANTVARWERNEVPIRERMALAARAVQIGFTDEHQIDHTINTHPVYEFQAWLQSDDKQMRQMSMWPGVMELSKEFFDSIIDHSVPLDPRAVGALKDSVLALDAYAWLAHRLRRIRQPGGLFLSWQNLYDQFGQEGPVTT